MEYILAGNGLSSGVAIFLVILFVIVAGVAICFLWRGVRKDRNRLIAEKLKKGELDRNAFDELLKRKFRTANKNTHFCVFRIELNNAVMMRETLGEKQYQSLSLTIEDRLSKVLPRGSKICRYDFDTLIVFSDEDLDAKSIGDIAAFCLLEGHKSVSLTTRMKVEPDLNIGVAVYSPFSAEFGLLMQNLELALMVAKKSGVNQFTIYSPELSNSESEEYKYYQEIKSAIDHGEFTLYFQPIVDVGTLQTVGYESLLRWNHRTMGVLSPAKFLDILEQSGDIHWVGVWAFEQLLSKRADYRKNHPDQNATFSMNLSPKQLMNEHLVEDLRRVLKKHRTEASGICLEIVEFALFEKLPIVRENVENLRKCGFEVAIDDFSLENNTMKLIESLSVDMIKLDRKFVEDAKDNFLAGGIVGALIGYAQKNGIRVVAEGIEDDVTLEYIREQGIPYGQGYYFGKPQAPEAYGI